MKYTMYEKITKTIRYIIYLLTYYLLTFHEKDLKNIEVQRQYNRLLSGI